MAEIFLAAYGEDHCTINPFFAAKKQHEQMT
jgi:hypothetical protein